MTEAIEFTPSKVRLSKIGNDYYLLFFFNDEVKFSIQLSKWDYDKTQKNLEFMDVKKNEWNQLWKRSTRHYNKNSKTVSKNSWCSWKNRGSELKKMNEVMRVCLKCKNSREINDETDNNGDYHCNKHGLLKPGQTKLVKKWI